MAIIYPRGTIVVVSQVPDKNGVNPKDRRVVLVRDLDDADTYAYGIAVTGTFTHPLPATAVPLPYHRQGRCKTGLTKDCVADCTWIVVAAPEDLIRRNGFTPASELLAILQQVQSLLPTLAPPPPPPSTTPGS